MNLVFATHNQHKLQEAQSKLLQSAPFVALVSLDTLGFTEDIPETGDTLQENALQKAQAVYNRYGIPCFSDDTGLEIEALGGAPGVYSARFAGEHCSFEDNMCKVLQLLDGQTNRKACFKTVIALIVSTTTHYFFEGHIEGTIHTERKGIEGFGYDPIFVPCDDIQTFAEMPLSEKNKRSHRALALDKLIQFLKDNEAKL
ncbi:non-canonical purine NTP pyrophosphatase [Bacteroidia bacterium]|nr:non-canonical purine NTP pyrophosphatase [Bacteroidia bacterium]